MRACQEACPYSWRRSDAARSASSSARRYSRQVHTHPAVTPVPPKPPGEGGYGFSGFATPFVRTSSVCAGGAQVDRPWAKPRDDAFPITAWDYPAHGRNRQGQTADRTAALNAEIAQTAEDGGTRRGEQRLNVESAAEADKGGMGSRQRPGFNRPAGAPRRCGVNFSPPSGLRLVPARRDSLRTHGRGYLLTAPTGPSRRSGCRACRPPPRRVTFLRPPRGLGGAAAAGRARTACHPCTRASPPWRHPCRGSPGERSAPCRGCHPGLESSHPSGIVEGPCVAEVAGGNTVAALHGREDTPGASGQPLADPSGRSADRSQAGRPSTSSGLTFAANGAAAAAAEGSPRRETGGREPPPRAGSPGRGDGSGVPRLCRPVWATPYLLWHLPFAGSDCHAAGGFEHASNLDALPSLGSV